MSIAKAYRNGPVEVGDHCATIVEFWKEYDAYKPEGRSGRLESIYASPSMAGVIRWVRSNHMTQFTNGEANLNTYALTVNDADNVYVYSIDLYDRFFSYDGISEENAKAYWASGIRLSQWEEVARERGLNPSDWEVLIPEDKVKSFKKLSDNMIAKAAPEYAIEELKTVLKNRKEFLKWHDWEAPVAA